LSRSGTRAIADRDHARPKKPSNQYPVKELA
jgi:hypothetical protein